MAEGSARIERIEEITPETVIVTARMVAPEVLTARAGQFLSVRIDAKATNELGYRLFAHTSPVHVEVGGKRVFDVEAALALQKQTEEARTEIRANGKFSSPRARDAILSVYDEAIEDLKKRIAQRGQ